MKVSIMINLCSLLFCCASFANASSNTQKRYRCEAECFVLSSDGATVIYTGLKSSAPEVSKHEAFAAIKEQCNYPNLLMRRKLISLQTENITVDTWEGSWFITPHRINSRVSYYQFTHPKTRAVFKTVEATEKNSCEETELPLPPPTRTVYGDPVQAERENTSKTQNENFPTILV